MAHCINTNHPEAQSLAHMLNIHPAAAAAKIARWQEETDIMDRFPTYEELMGVESAFAFNRYEDKKMEVSNEDLADAFGDDIINTPAFKYLVTELTPTLGDIASKEALRDYMEYGRLRDADDILSKVKAQPFSPIVYQTSLSKEAMQGNEVEMTMTQKLKDLGISHPGKVITEVTKMRIAKAISALNQKNIKRNIPRTFKLIPTQYGQTGDFTWAIVVLKGNTNQAAKLEKLKATIQNNPILPTPEQQQILDNSKAINEDKVQGYLSSSAWADSALRKLAEGLKMQLGVDYDFITPAEAYELTKNSKNPWKGENHLFFGGKVYIIQGTGSPHGVLHEFAHPIIKSIAKQNKPLFNKLYQDLKSTQEGARLISEIHENYPDFDLESDDFKEEALVKALEKKYFSGRDEIQNSKDFDNFLDKILFAIKQFLRDLFGKGIHVSTLSPKTTLQELVNMLKEGKHFDLDAEIITDDDLVNYSREYSKYMGDFVAENADAKEIREVTTKYFDAINKQLRSLHDKKDLGALLDLFENKYKTGELQVMRKNLKSYQESILQDSKELEDDVELTRQRVAAVVNSLGNVQNLATKLHAGILDLVKDIDNPDNVQRALYYQKTLNYWQEVVNDIAKVLERNGVSNLKMVDSINATVRKANDQLDDFYMKASEGVLWNKLSVAAANIEHKWEEHIASLRARNAPQNIIDAAIKKQGEERITPEAIRKALSGELKDLNIANAYLEGYGYSPDPVVGGLALFVKDSINDLEAKAQAKFNKDIQELKPLLDAVGYNPNKPGELGDKLAQVEKVGRLNPDTGELEVVEVKRFMNQFIGADFVRDEYFSKIKKAQLKYSETGAKVDKQALADVQSEWETHRREFYNNEYSEDFYKLYDIFRTSEVGREAALRMNDLYDELNLLSGQLSTASSQDILEISDSIETVRRQIKQLASLYSLAGEPKTGPELDIALKIQEFNKKATEVYESVEIPGAFSDAYQAYERKLLDEGKKQGSAEFTSMMDKWVERNTRVSITDEFWEETTRINTAIKRVLSKLPKNDALQLEVEQAYETIKEVIRGNRDESGQPLGSELSVEQQETIRAAQVTINEARQQLARASGLSRQEQNEIDIILAKIRPGQRMSAKDAATLGRLFDKQSSLRLDKIHRAELNSLYAELDRLRSKEPTDSYVDAVNNLLADMDAEVVYETLGSLTVDKETVSKITKAETAAVLMGLSDDFSDWFLRNHTEKEYADYATNDLKTVWEKTHVWNVIKPKDDKFYEKSQVTSMFGNKVDFDRVPAMKYYKRLVKPEYVTEGIEGVTVDNRGYWLPKNKAQGAKDDRYINKDYERLRTSDPKLFALLEKFKEIHLNNQKGLNGKAKLYLDMPRFRKQTAERLQSKNAITRIAQRMKDFWHKVQDGWENGFNYDDNMQLIKMDLFDDNTANIPMAGIANIPLEEVSGDIVYTTMRYMLSAERNKQLNSIAPMARMIQGVVNNKKNYPLEQKILNNSTLYQPGTKKSKYMRAQAVNNYLEKMLEGKVNTGFGSDSAIANNISKAMFGMASNTFMALNIPSAIKNQIGMKFQGMIEAMAGKYMSPRDFIAAEGWATATAMQISTEIYKQGPKSLSVQMSELFDPERDRFFNHFAESTTRTAQKDYSYDFLHRLTDVRRWTQLQAALQLFNGMMRHQLVPMADGSKIPYSEAWQVKDGLLQLKDGVDPSWGITYQNGEMLVGENFKRKRNEMHRVLDNLNGAMAKEDRPEADRYLAYRYVSFFRRFLTGMLVNRFAYSGSLRAGTSRGRYDYQLGDTKEGWYITFMKLLGTSLKNLGRNLPYMTPEEKAAAIRMTSEVGFITVLKFLILPLVFGWDPDDEDKYKKIRANSDALPLPWVYDDPSRDFKLTGWLFNHAMLQTFQVTGENEQFLPFPGYGLDSYKDMLDLKSVAFGPTVKTAFDVVRDLYNMSVSNDNAYYKRNANPYLWGQQGDPKVLTHLAKSIGLTGGVVDPSQSIKNFQAIQNK